MKNQKNLNRRISLLSMFHFPFILALAAACLMNICEAAAQQKDTPLTTANAFRAQSKNDSALFYYKKALIRFEEAKNDEAAANVKSQIATVLSVMRKYDEAIALNQECLEYYVLTGNHLMSAAVFHEIGAIYGNMQLNDLSMEYYLKTLSALEQAEETKTSVRIAGVAHNNIAVQLLKKKEYDEVLEHIGKALTFHRKNNDMYYAGIVLDVKIECLSELGHHAEALHDLKEMEEIAQQLNNNRFTNTMLIAKGKIYMGLKQYRQAYDAYRQSLAYADTTWKERLHNTYRGLAEASAYAGTPAETQGYIQKFARYATDAFTEEWSSKISEMEIKYETEKKEHEIDRQQQIIARQDSLRRALIAVVALCVAMLVLLWYTLRLRNRRNLALTEKSDALSRLNHALEEMNLTKDKFFSIISHDLKNPAVAQRDAIQVLVKTSGSWNAGTLADYHAELLNTAEGQVELIFNLLDWARLQTGRMNYMPAPFNIAARLRTDISQTRSMAEKKGVALLDDIPVHAQITADGNMISTVVRNLLANAVKFTASGGTVSLTVVSGKNTVFTVSDTGIGISGEHLQNLFRIDGQHLREGTAAEQGSGLGLIICRELLEIHGSELHVESEEGIKNRKNAKSAEPERQSNPSSDI